MTDKKTTEFDYASLIDGSELIGIIQGGGNYKATITDILVPVTYQRFVHLGMHSSTVGVGIAIGYYANAAARPNAVAIGNYAFAGGRQSVAIGDHAYVNYCNRHSIAIGDYAKTYSAYSVAIGGHAQTAEFFSVAIGYASGARSGLSYDGTGRNVFLGAYASSGVPTSYAVAIGFTAQVVDASVALGAYSIATGDRSIAIGYGAQAVNSHQITIGASSTGHHESVVVGFNSYSGPFGVAIGNYIQPDATIPYTISVGYRSGASGLYSVAVGAHALTNGASSVVIGDHAYSNAPNGIGIGKHVNALRSNVIAIGSIVSCYGDSGIAIGSNLAVGGSYSITIGNSVSNGVGSSVALGGNPTLTPLSPHEMYQRFVGNTMPPTAASLRLQNSTIFAPASLGASANTSVVSTSLPGPNNTLNAAFTGHALHINLQTDGDGVFVDAVNTLANIAALFPLVTSSGTFTMTVDSGHGSDVVNSTYFIAFSGGVDGVDDVMTSDGLTPGASNLPAMANTSVATLTGRVTGVQAGHLNAGSGDAASFVLEPVMVTRHDDSSYIFNGTATFTPENATSGGSAWEVPTLIIDGGNSLNIVVSNSTVEVDWMAHLKFETS